MALLLFQALPEGLPASVEPAQVRAALKGPPGGVVWGLAVPGGRVHGAGGLPRGTRGAVGAAV